VTACRARHWFPGSITSVRVTDLSPSEMNLIIDADQVSYLNSLDGEAVDQKFGPYTCRDIALFNDQMQETCKLRNDHITPSTWATFCHHGQSRSLSSAKFPAPARSTFGALRIWRAYRHKATILVL
jgi:hypothetical protein